MAPITDPLTDKEMPRARLGLLLQHFSELDDDREPWRVMYPLKEVLLLVTCATIASCDDFDDIVAWGEHHLDALRRFAEFHHGIPCERWLRALVNRIDPGPPAKGNVSREPDRALPFTLEHALEMLANAKVLPSYFGQEAVTLYRDTKAEELARFRRIITAEEYDWYL